MQELVSGYTLIEGPVWDPTRGLLFSDVHDGGVYCLNSGGDVETVVPHRRGIGGMALHAEGGLVVGGRNVAYKGPAASGTVALLDQERAGGIGFNDLTTDHRGRVYVGSLGASPFDPEAAQVTGHLHVIDLDGSHRVLADDVRLTNGLGFSPDGSRLYHADSRKQIVGVHEVSADGSVGARAVFASFDVGNPDGLAVAADGRVFVAMAGGSCVQVLSEAGEPVERLACPLPMVTSVCFGGSELADLYVVTGSVGADSEHAGTIYRVEGVGPGLELSPARVAL